MKVDVIIPVYKPGNAFLQMIDMLEQQTIKVNKIILMNTEKQYYDALCKERDLEKQYDNILVEHLLKEEFDHGKTRDEGVKLSDADIFIMMTQDAMPYDTQLIEKLVDGLQDEKVGACFAKQLPYPDCKALEVFQRKFNYPDESQKKSLEDVERLGIKTFFCSNVCCAYKREVYDRVGGFVKDAIFNEDMIYAHALMTAGFQVYYNAEAKVYHSHNYSFMQQFHRNFDLGVSQAQHPEVFGNIKSESEGIKSVKQAAGYLRGQNRYGEIGRLVVHSGFKFMGYKLGKAYKKLPKGMVRSFSMNKEYWK